MRKFRIACAVGLLGALLGGTAQAKIADLKLCKDLGQLKSSVTNLDNLPPGASMEDVKGAANKVKQAGQQVAQQAAKAPNGQNLNLAIQQLKQGIQQLPPNVSGDAAKAQLKPQIDQLRSATQQFAGTYCPK